MNGHFGELFNGIGLSRSHFQIICVNRKTISTVLISPASKFEIWRQGQCFLRSPNLVFQVGLCVVTVTRPLELEFLCATASHVVDSACPTSVTSSCSRGCRACWFEAVLRGCCWCWYLCSTAFCLHPLLSSSHLREELLSLLQIKEIGPEFPSDFPKVLCSFILPSYCLHTALSRCLHLGKESLQLNCNESSSPEP